MLAVNGADRAPAGTVTVAGTDTTDVFPLLSVTTAPPGGAIADKVTVPVEDAPPVTAVGFKVMADTLAGATVPITAISARPMFWPTAVLTVNRIDVTVREGNEIVRGAPLFGNVPTGTLLPSLKDNVAEVTLSTGFGLS